MPRLRWMYCIIGLACLFLVATHATRETDTRESDYEVQIAGDSGLTESLGALSLTAPSLRQRGATPTQQLTAVQRAQLPYVPPRQSSILCIVLRKWATLWALLSSLTFGGAFGLTLLLILVRLHMSLPVYHPFLSLFYMSGMLVLFFSFFYLLASPLIILKMWQRRSDDESTWDPSAPTPSRNLSWNDIKNLLSDLS